MIALGVIGWLAWTRGAIVGLPFVEFDSPLSLAALGFLAGVGGFFAPCAFTLFPAYVSYYLTTARPQGGAARALGLGLACAGGAILFFGLVGAILTFVGSGISPYLLAAKPVVALAVIALGVVQLLDVQLPRPALLGLSIGPRPWMPSAVAVFVYGFGYALASTGCTLPLYVSITVIPLTSGFSGAALLTFLAFASAMALLMLLTTLLVGLAREQLIAALHGWTAWIQRASGVILIGAGLYLGAYYLKTGM